MCINVLYMGLRGRKGDLKMSLLEVVLSAAIAAVMSLVVCIGSGVIVRKSIARIFHAAAAQALSELEEDEENYVE